HIKNPKASEFAHLVKTDYFRVSPKDLQELTEAFDQRYAALLRDEHMERPSTNLTLSDTDQRAALGIGRWAPDVLENVIAYVGSELRVAAWVERAQRLIDVFPSPETVRSIIAGGDSEAEDAAAAAEDEASPDDAAAKTRRKKPAPIHPA